MNFDKNNPDQEKFLVRWWEDDHMSPDKAKEQVVHSTKEGAELLEWISSNNWSYTVQ
tara:strand:+ start:756 stop:926 length:171 start_codon:yes stop_codon:yes gene_type:complete